MIKKLRLKGQDRIRRKVQVEARYLLCYWAVRERTNHLITRKTK